MYTIVGLGNPGEEYVRTRHNAGRILVTMLADEYRIELKKKKDPAHEVGVGEIYGQAVRLVIPDTFMNRSGKAVLPYAKSKAAAKNVIVIHDDLDLPLGSVRVSFGSSAGGHNGVKSVIAALKTPDFVRIRVGVARLSRGRASKPSGEKAVLDYLLGKFLKAEHEKLIGPIKKRVSEAILPIIEKKDHVAGMNAVNGLPIL